MLEAVERTVSRSFLCLWFVVSQSVMLVERLFFAEQNALSCGEDVWLCMCACVRVGFEKKKYAHVARLSCNDYYYYYLYYYYYFTKKDSMRYTKLQKMVVTTCDVHKPP